MPNLRLNVTVRSWRKNFWVERSPTLKTFWTISWSVEVVILTKSFFLKNYACKSFGVIFLLILVQSLFIAFQFNEKVAFIYVMIKQVHLFLYFIVSVFACYWWCLCSKENSLISDITWQLTYSQFDIFECALLT